MKKLSQKIDLVRPSEDTIIFNIAVRLLSDNVGVSLEYYVKGTECRNARFDVVLYDKQTLDIIAVIEVKRNYYSHKVELITDEGIEHQINQIQRYYGYLKKYNIPLILVSTRLENANLAAKKIREILKY